MSSKYTPVKVDMEWINETQRTGVRTGVYELDQWTWRLRHEDRMREIRDMDIREWVRDINE